MSISYINTNAVAHLEVQAKAPEQSGASACADLAQPATTMVATFAPLLPNTSPNTSPNPTTPALKAAQFERLPELITQIALGDEPAFAQFYQILLRQAHALVRRIVDHAQGVDDVLEDAFWQAWREADRYTAERGSVQAWFLTICRSRALDYLRRQDRAIMHPDPHALQAEQEHQQTGAPQEDSPLDLLLALQSTSLVRQAVAQLAATERHLIALAFFKDLTHQEIATACDMPLGTVKTVLRRAFKQMQAMLDNPNQATTYQ
jgi:RNA polymerase sigma factor (sigma-70 family)